MSRDIKSASAYEGKPSDLARPREAWIATRAPRRASPPRRV